jgi:hypothetical protein
MLGVPAGDNTYSGRQEVQFFLERKRTGLCADAGIFTGGLDIRIYIMERNRIILFVVCIFVLFLNGRKRLIVNSVLIYMIDGSLRYFGISAQHNGAEYHKGYKYEV